MNNSTGNLSDYAEQAREGISGYYFIATPYAQLIAAICVIGACAVTLHQMYCHLKNYSCYPEQRYIVRLLTIVPVYGLCAFISIILLVYARLGDGYIEGIQDVAEALTIYSFLSLCYQYLGGEGNIMLDLHGRTIEFSLLYGTCCFHGKPYTIIFLRFCKIATLQYTLIKPFTAVISIIMIAKGVYPVGDFRPSSGYLYIFLIDNLSVTLALYGLLLFYFATRHQLKPYSPILKFITIKSIIFFSFWQDVLFSILEWSHVVGASQGYPSGLVSHGYKNLLLCVELVFIAVALRFAFPHTPYVLKSPGRLVFTDTDPIIEGSQSFDVAFKGVREDKLNMLFAVDDFPHTDAGSHVDSGVPGSGQPMKSSPPQQHSLSNGSPSGLVPSISASIRATIDPRDIVADTIHNFARQYRDYTQPNQEEQ